MSDVTKPVIVPASPAGTQAVAATRDVLLLVAALPALVAVLGRGNVKEIVDWFASEPGLAFVATAIVVVTALWRQIAARRVVRELQVMEPHVPSDVAVRTDATK